MNIIARPRRAGPIYMPPLSPIHTPPPITDYFIFMAAAFIIAAGRQEALPPAISRSAVTHTADTTVDRPSLS